MIDADLSRLSDLARALCDQHCDERCRWHHGVWPDLRRLGLVSEPRRHEAFFRRALRSVAGDRILVSGAADPGMLAQVIAARPRARVTVLDRCATPVELSRQAAAWAGVHIEPAVADVLEWRPAHAYDGIVTHSFLPFFSPAHRPAVMAAWARALAPGGLLVLTNRIDDGPGAGARGFADPEAFAIRALERAVALHLDVPNLAQRALAYARHAASWPLRSADDLANLLVGADLRVVSLESVLMPGGAAGPGTRQAATYVEVIATRA